MTSTCSRLLIGSGVALLLLAFVAGCSQPFSYRPATPTPALAQKPQLGAPKEVQKPYYFPDRPITILTGAERGAREDIAARVLTPWLEKTLGQPVLVVNRPGSQGAELWSQVKQAKPEGYVLGQVVSPQLQTSTSDYQKAGFTVSDFVAVAGQTWEPDAIFVRSASPFKTVEELVDAARVQADRISISMVRGSAVDEVAAAQLQRRAGVKLRDIQYRNATDALMAVLSGQVDAEVAALAAVAPSATSGQGRLLAILDDSRLKNYPEVPTLKERSLDVVAASSLGYLLPKSTSPDLVEFLAWAFYLAISNPEHQNRMGEAGIAAKYVAGDRYGQLLSSDAERVKQLLAGR